MEALLDMVATVGKKPERSTPVRLTDDAIKWARIASGYTGESMAQYVSRITVERGKQDADRLHADLSRGLPSDPAPAPPRSGGPRKGGGR